MSWYVHLIEREVDGQHLYYVWLRSSSANLLCRLLKNLRCTLRCTRDAASGMVGCSLAFVGRSFG